MSRSDDQRLADLLDAADPSAKCLRSRSSGCQEPQETIDGERLADMWAGQSAVAAIEAGTH